MQRGFNRINLIRFFVFLQHQELSNQAYKQVDFKLLKLLSIIRPTPLYKSIIGIT